MGFSPDLVGLMGERNTGDFFEMRKGCPHKGIDISSSKKSLPFKAGIYGRVTFAGGSYNTVAIQPMDGSAIHVQYLHCKSFSVSEGAIVAPWTVVGATGDTAPPGTDITGIHLHLQVQVSGAGQECWELNGRPRNFVNPETHPTPDLMVGSWFISKQRSIGGYQITDRSEFRIYSSSVGGRVAQQRVSSVLGTNGCKTEILFSWPNAQISNHGKNNVAIKTPSGDARYLSDGCRIGGSPSANPGLLEDITLTSMNALSFPGGRLKRMGRFSNGLELVPEIRDWPSSAEKEVGQEDRSLSFFGGFNPLAFDPYGISVILEGLSEQHLSGVAENEVF